MNRAKASGFVLLPVILTLALLAIVTALLLEHGGTGGSVAAAQQQSEALAYAAEAGFNHGRALLEQNGCLSAMALPDTELGDYTYSAVMPSTGATVPPATYKLTAVADAWVDEDDKSKNHGTDAVLKNKREGGKDKRSVFLFDLSSVPADLDVATASFWLYVKSKDDSGDPVNIHRIVVAWAENTVNWFTVGDAGEYDDTLVHASFVPNQDGFLSVDIAPLVRQWLTGKIPNNGIVLLSTSNKKESQYASRQEAASIWPRLDIVGRPNAFYAIDALGRDAAGVERAVSRTVEGPADSVLFLDYFDAGYAGNDGTRNFTTDWREVGENNGAGAGAIRVEANSDCAYANCLEIDAGLLSTAGAWRQLGLAGADSVILRLHTRRQGGNWRLEISGNGGASWQTLKSTASANDSNQVRDAFDISAYAAANTRIRITSNSVLGLGRKDVYIDDVQVEATCGP